MFANDAKHHQRDYHRRQHNILILSLFIADKSDMDDKIALKMHTNKNFQFFDIMKNSILFSIKLDNNKSSLIRPHFHKIWTICIYEKKKQILIILRTLFVCQESLWPLPAPRTSELRPQ